MRKLFELSEQEVALLDRVKKEQSWEAKWPHYGISCAVIRSRRIRRN